MTLDYNCYVQSIISLIRSSIQVCLFWFGSFFVKIFPFIILMKSIEEIRSEWKDRQERERVPDLNENLSG
jgi:hypothetical protein